MTGALRWRELLLFGRAQDPPRSWVGALLFAALAFAGALWWHAPLLYRTQYMIEGGHNLFSILLASHAAFCGKPSHMLPSIDPARDALLTSRNFDVPIAQVLGSVHGGLESYCAAVTSPFLNNEAGFGLVVRGLLAARPDTSLADLSTMLVTTRVIGIAIVTLLLARWKASLLFLAAFAWLALDVLADTVSGFYVLSLYPFLYIAVLLGAAVYGVALSQAVQRRLWASMSVIAVAGAFTAFAVSLRTSHAPIYLGMFAGHLVTCWYLFWRGPAARLRVLQSVVMFTVAAVAFHTLVIAPTQTAESDYNRGYHVVGHSVVIGLGLPPNPLAEREGIRWDDGVGWKLAQRIDPDVPYLGPGYERALFTYYWQLWRDRPREMIDTYLFKARSAFEATVVGSVTTAYSRSRVYGNGNAGTLARLPRVQQLLPLALIVPMVCVVYFRRQIDVRQQWMFWAVSFAALLVYLEAALILSVYQSSYHGVIVMGTLVLALAAVQWSIEGVARAIAVVRREGVFAKRRLLIVAAGAVAAVAVGYAGNDILVALARQLSSPPVVVTHGPGIVKANEPFVVQLSRPARAEVFVYANGRLARHEPASFGREFVLAATEPGPHELHVSIDDERWGTRVLDVTNFRVVATEAPQ